MHIQELSEHVRAHRISPVEIVKACLERIEELNPTLNAFITVLKEPALEAAQVAEVEIKAGNWRGPLHGIPVGIRDFHDTAGIRTTAAFEHLKNRVPQRDANSVAKLKNAGAIVIGKTNMHQLGMGTTGMDSYFGPVRNPWNPAYIPGGSSSGSAVAVASQMCHATLDTDAIGSCRLPAACCGVVGFKGHHKYRSRPKEYCRTGVSGCRYSVVANDYSDDPGDPRRRCKPTGALRRKYGIRELLWAACSQRPLRLRQQWPAYWITNSR